MDYIKAKNWQTRAKELYDSGDGDCDTRCYRLIEEMKKDGLRVGRDFVVDRGHIGDGQHMRLIMRGDYVVDPAFPKTHRSSPYYKSTFRGKFSEA